MANYQIAYNATTLAAVVQNKGDALPAGSTKIGEFKHDAADDNLGNTATENDNHVFYHHVRDALYKVGQYNMQIVTISIDTVYTALTNYTIVQTSPQALAVNANLQLTHVFTPTGASNKALAYVSSVPAKATVSPTGLVHGVASGQTIITVTSSDGVIVKTITINVA